MGSVRDRNGKYIAEALANGKRKSKTHKTKKAAWAWISKAEAAMEAGDLPDKTFADLLDRYAANVSIHKKSHLREVKRIAAINRDEIGAVKLCDLNAPVITAWRDRRVRATSAATARRDWSVMGHACNLAVNEWHWLKINPMMAVKKPKKPPYRKRVLSDDEVEKMLLTTGHGDGTLTAQVAICMLFALETAMRAGEICNTVWANVHERHIHLPETMTKNGKSRDIPLSTAARELIALQSKEDPVFGINTSQLDSLWRKCRDRAMIEDLHFHDTRRTTLTRLAKTFDVMDLAKISGHLDLRILQECYYAPTVDDLADKLD